MSPMHIDSVRSVGRAVSMTGAKKGDVWIEMSNQSSRMRQVNPSK